MPLRIVRFICAGFYRPSIRTLRVPEDLQSEGPRCSRNVSFVNKPLYFILLSKFELRACGR